MAQTFVRPCKCVSAGQDHLYGKGNRLFNDAPKKDPKGSMGRCTVCSAVLQKPS